MQGRLVPSSNGELQCGPGARWAEEFSIAHRLGLAHIELMAERVPESSNPIWSAPGRRAIRAVVASTGVEAPCLCVNETLAESVEGADAGERLASRLQPLASELRLRTVVIPLDEASALEAVDWRRAADGVRALASALGPIGTTVALEANVSAETSTEFLDLVDVDAVGLCYDVGNATALGFSTESEVRSLGTKIVHVHAKDKDDAGVNVQFGTGKVPFQAAFAALHDVGFDGLVTMEATRGDDPVVSAVWNRGWLLALERDDGP
jgi:sugar phosphate isomerase/epimerase